MHLEYSNCVIRIIRKVSKWFHVSNIILTQRGKRNKTKHLIALHWANFFTKFYLDCMHSFTLNKSKIQLS
jgi:hypothetical protein